MKNLRIFLLMMAYILPQCGLIAQVVKNNFSIKDGCNFASAMQPGEISITEPSEEAREIVQEILSENPNDYNPKIILNTGPVQNAVALENNGQRYIIYNAEFMELFKTRSLTSQAARFLLAHEVGHHVLKHHFGNKTRAESHRDELQADDFAARIMSRLGATLDETLAGIHTFSLSGASETHPDPSAREEVINTAWREEVSILAPKPLKKTPLQLDESAFKNPWNVISSAKADIDDEKITISFKIPQEYQSRNFRICLKSNDFATIPESRTSKTVGGTGYNLPYQEDGKVVWNYKLDKFVQSEAGRPNMLRVYVYEMHHQPKYPSQVSGWVTGGAGIGGIVWGITKRANAVQIYDSEYKISFAEEDYKKADRLYVQSQFIMAGGALLLGTSTWILIRKSKLAKEVTKSICSQDAKWKIEPAMLAGGNIGLYAQYRF